jgi:hypothetical protein
MADENDTTVSGFRALRQIAEEAKRNKEIRDVDRQDASMGSSADNEIEDETREKE